MIIFVYMKVIQIELEESLHQKFKVKCATKSQRIKDALKELIESYVAPLKLEDESKN